MVALALCAQAGAWAQSPSAGTAPAFPTKPIRVIVPFTPGSGTDIMARTVSEGLSKRLGQPLIVENRPGAGGTIGEAIVAKAEPDGYTLLVHSSSYTVTPSTYKNLPFDTVRDLMGILPLGQLPNVLVISPSKGIHSVKELVAAAKKKPGAMNSASVGVGSATHLNAERFRLGAGIDVVNIPFKGTPEALTEVIAGRVDYYFCPVNAALPMIKEGKVLALAVGSSDRSKALPELPTTLESGVLNSDYNFWVGMFGPAKMKRDLVAHLYDETVKVLEAPDVREKMSRLGAEPMPFTPGRFNLYLQQEIQANAELVKKAGIKAQ
jgi:tripartite-type tricarboxylate transporter receptor subunit TctC